MGNCLPDVIKGSRMTERSAEAVTLMVLILYQSEDVGATYFLLSNKHLPMVFLLFSRPWSTIQNIPYYSFAWSVTLREKCPNTEFFLVRIFLHSDWIRKFIQIQENTNQKKFRIWILFTQCSCAPMYECIIYVHFICLLGDCCDRQPLCQMNLNTLLIVSLILPESVVQKYFSK